MYRRTAFKTIRLALVNAYRVSRVYEDFAASALQNLDDVVALDPVNRDVFE